MGNDGGSIPDRRDLVRNKPKAEQADKHNQLIARWFFCALSKRPLEEPIVSCALGQLYNKDALLEFLLDRSSYGDGERICGHVRGLKDVVTLQLTPNPTPPPENGDSNGSPHARFVCPLTMKEMSGTQPFVCLVPCGHVFSAAGLRAMRSGGEKDDEEKQLCPQCSAKFSPRTDVRTINPVDEELDKVRAALPTRGKKRKAAAPAEGDKRHAPSTNAAVAIAARKAVAAAAATAPRDGVSAAVASLYADKNAPVKKETFLTQGTFTRYA